MFLKISFDYYSVSLLIGIFIWRIVQFSVYKSKNRELNSFLLIKVIKLLAYPWIYAAVCMYFSDISLKDFNFKWDLA